MSIQPDMDSNLEIVSLRGKALVELDRFEEALKDLDMAIEVEEQFIAIQAQGYLRDFMRDWSLLDYRGEAMRQLGRFDDALTSFDQVRIDLTRHVFVNAGVLKEFFF